MEEPSEMKVSENEPEENIVLESTAEKKYTFSAERDIEYCEEELRKKSFLYADDTVKSGDALDFVSCFCGIFALACLGIVSYFGVKNGVSHIMLFLIPMYVLIAVFSLCHPLQVKISESWWNFNFIMRIATKRGYLPEVEVSEEKDTVRVRKQVTGEEDYEIDSQCFFFETEHYIVLHVTDRKLFPISKAGIEDEEMLDMLKKLCINYPEETDVPESTETAEEFQATEEAGTTEEETDPTEETDGEAGTAEETGAFEETEAVEATEENEENKPSEEIETAGAAETIEAAEEDKTAEETKTAEEAAEQTVACETEKY